MVTSNNRLRLWVGMSHSSSNTSSRRPVVAFPFPLVVTARDWSKTWLLASTFSDIEKLAWSCPHPKGTHQQIAGALAPEGHFLSRDTAQYPPLLAAKVCWADSSIAYNQWHHDCTFPFGPIFASQIPCGSTFPQAGWGRFCLQSRLECTAFLWRLF